MRDQKLSAFVVVLLVAAFMRHALAEDLAPVPAESVLKDFFSPFYHPFPNQNQLRQVIRAAEAIPQGNTNIALKDVTMETYTTNGVLELTVHAPMCNWSIHENVASSPGHIEARSADGKTLLEGEGFLWDNTTSQFFISNRVHTIIQTVIEKPKSP